MTELEAALVDELLRFEKLMASARRGSTIKLLDITLFGESFVSIFRDLPTHCTDNWDRRDCRCVSSTASASIARRTEVEMSIKDC